MNHPTFDIGSVNLSQICIVFIASFTKNSDHLSHLPCNNNGKPKLSLILHQFIKDSDQIKNHFKPTKLSIETHLPFSPLRLTREFGWNESCDKFQPNVVLETKWQIELACMHRVIWCAKIGDSNYIIVAAIQTKDSKWINFIHNAIL